MALSIIAIHPTISVLSGLDKPPFQPYIWCMTSFFPLPSRRIIAVSGAEARAFVHSLFSVDVLKLPHHKAVYGLLLSPQGKILHDVFVIAVDDALWLDIDSNQADALYKRLNIYKLKRDVQLQLVNNIQVAALLDAPSADTHVAPLLVVDDPRLSVLGKRIYSNQPIVAALFGAEEKTSEDYTLACLALGVPDSADIRPDTYFTFDLDMDDLHAVDYQKGCYVGQEVTARMHYRGTPKKGIYIVHTTDKHHLPADASLICEGKAAGALIRTIGQQGLAVFRHEFANGAVFAEHLEGPLPVVISRPGWAKAIAKPQEESV